MKLRDMETELKELIEKDINNEQIFIKIFELCKKYLQATKKVNYNIIDDISSILAEDLYMKILKGDKITFWISYISKFYYSAINQYKKMFDSEIIETKNNRELYEAVIRMNSANNDSEIDYFCDNIFLKYIPEIINLVLDNSRYKINTLEYENSKISLILSLMSGNPVHFRINKEEKMYVNYLYSVLRNMIYRYIKENSSNETLEQNLTLLQLYTLSIGEVEI